VLLALLHLTLLAAAPRLSAADITVFAEQTSPSVGGASPLHITSQSVRYLPETGEFSAEGNVTAEYENLSISAPSAIGNADEQWMLLTGGIVLESKGETAFGSELYIDLKERSWRLTDATGTLTPRFLGGKTTAPLYIQGPELYGGRAELQVVWGGFTSCDLEHPHYTIEAREIDVYPEDKVIARHAAMRVHGKRLITIGYLVYPLHKKGERDPLVPRLGQSRDEGMFLKTRYNYPTGGTYGALNLDLMERKGIGYGIAQDYKLGATLGSIVLYFLKDKASGTDSMTGRWTQDGKLFGNSLRITHELRQRSYLYSTASTTASTTLTFNRPLTTGARSATSLSYTGIVSKGFFYSATAQANWRQDYIMSSNWRAQMNLGLSQQDRHIEDQGADQNLDASLSIRGSEGPFDIELSHLRRHDLDRERNTQDTRYSLFEKFSEVSVSTGAGSSSQQLGWGFLAPLRPQVELTYGDYMDNPSGVRAERWMLDSGLTWSSRARSQPASRAIALRGSVQYRQYFYSDDTAQYAVEDNLSLSIPLWSKGASFQLRHSMRRRRGYTPFMRDIESRRHLLTGNLVIARGGNERFMFSAGSGYDFRNDDYPWQTLQLQLHTRPHRNYDFTFSTGRDLNRDMWRPLIGRMRWELPSGRFVELGARYDLESDQLELLRGEIDTGFWKKWRLEALFGYDGRTREFEYTHFRLTRDLHCWTASVTVMNELRYSGRRQVLFELGIKAFPTKEKYGTGFGGQGFGTSVGQGF
jgi:hypothetical protein